MGVNVGSSPHTRGARRGSNRPPRCRRIIPAYAGSTSSGVPTTTRRTDHPRIRGEHGRRRPADVRAGGSSPHTRGALVVFSLDPHFRRIIPAYAGSTMCPASPPPLLTDHPRIRGEHSRTRRPDYRRSRIIPAYAGSTRSRSCARRSRMDHPRIRGEHGGCRPDPLGGRGSSPHTRGARSRSQPRAFQPRIIPAYAGSTPCPSERRRRSPDHPRIRGEHAGMPQIVP